MWLRRRIDITWSDLAFGLRHCCFPGRNRRGVIEQTWAGDAPTLACLSVRTGFDLVLQALGLPKGSEVLMSAVNVPAMFRLVEEHGLVAVPLDIDAASLCPTVAQVSHAITPKTRAIVIAHLFGTRVDLTDIAALAHERGLLVVEDHAQAFDRVPAELPTTADVALWSFGPIKAATALGGAIAAIRDRALAERMRVIEGRYAAQPQRRYALRLLKYAMLKAVSYRWPFGILVRTLSRARIDPDAWLTARVRSFGDDAPLLPALRWRPSLPLLALLDRRLRNLDPVRAACQRRRGLRLERLVECRAHVLGAAAAWRGFDLFAVVVPAPARLLSDLRQAGFDAGTRGNLVVLREEAEDGPGDARRLLDAAVFVPLYAAMPDAEVRRLGEVVHDATLASCNNDFARSNGPPRPER